MLNNVVILIELGDKMRNKNKVKLFKHQVLITAISVFAVVISMIGGSYAIFSSTSKADEYNVLKVGELEISYVDTGDGYGDVLSLNGAYPISDNEGASSTPYRFNITNTGTIAADFKIKILYDESIIEEDGCENNLLLPEYVKYKFDNEDPVLLSSKESEDYLIYEASNLLPGSSEIHEIRIWIDESAPNDILGKHFHGKVVVESAQSGIDESLEMEYVIGQSVTLKDGSKWHVLEDSSKSSAIVTLLSDYNLNSDGTYDVDCGKNINGVVNCNPQVFDEANHREQASYSYCTLPEYGCNQYEQNGSSVILDSSIKNWLNNTYLPIIKQSLTDHGGTIESLTVSLPTMEQLAKADNQSFSQNQVNFSSDWLTTTNYWTRTASNLNSAYVWSVVGEYNNSYIQYANNATQSGVRPVVVVSKQNIQG